MALSASSRPRSASTRFTFARSESRRLCSVVNKAPPIPATEAATPTRPLINVLLLATLLALTIRSASRYITPRRVSRALNRHPTCRPGHSPLNIEPLPIPASFISPPCLSESVPKRRAARTPAAQTRRASRVRSIAVSVSCISCRAPDRCGFVKRHAWCGLTTKGD